MKVETVPIASLRTDPDNARHHSERNLDAIRASMERFHQQRPILVGADNVVVAGNGTLAVALALGWTEIEIVRTELDGAEARAYAIADNRTAELADWDLGALAAGLTALDEEGISAGLLGFTAEELAEMLDPGVVAGDAEPDAIPPPPEQATTKRGDLILLGEHRLLCGDSTRPEHVERLFAGANTDLICTDPPYCSGGFQESGKAQGSVGRTAPHKQIANDRLSTRGYTALLGRAFGNIDAGFLYCFTDWRMWIHLFDVSESLGYGVRSMIVWDKGTPGMGRGWRSQHELVLWACKSTPPYGKHFSATGNVLSAARTGNLLHTTEKPVALLISLITNTPFAKSIADPFAGAGTTLIAAQQTGRRAFLMEIDPLYCDVIVTRYENFTGRKVDRQHGGSDDQRETRARAGKAQAGGSARGKRARATT